MAEAFDCDCCGACCRTWRIFVSDDDARREPRIACEGRQVPEHLATPEYRYQLFKLPFLEACCFLDGESRCTIYGTRPGVCRDFVAGGERCQEARRLAGLPPLGARGAAGAASLGKA